MGAANWRLLSVDLDHNGRAVFYLCVQKFMENDHRRAENEIVSVMLFDISLVNVQRFIRVASDRG